MQLKCECGNNVFYHGPEGAAAQMIECDRPECGKAYSYSIGVAERTPELDHLLAARDMDAKLRGRQERGVLQGSGDNR